MLAKNAKTLIRWDDPLTAEREAERILKECRIELPTKPERERASESIVMACAEYQHNEQLKRAPLNRQAMVQAKILLDAITTLQTILPGDRWERHKRIETHNQHLPKRSRKRQQFHLLTRGPGTLNYNMEMLRHWRPALRNAVRQRGAVIGGYPFAPPKKFKMGDGEYSDWNAEGWMAHTGELLDQLSAMIREQYGRSAHRFPSATEGKGKGDKLDLSGDDPLRSDRPREQKTKAEIAARANVSINNLILQLEFFWNALYGRYAPIDRIDDLDPPYIERAKLSDGQRFMWLVSRVCRSVGIGIGDNALSMRIRERRKATGIRAKR